MFGHIYMNSTLFLSQIDFYTYNKHFITLISGNKVLML